MYAHKAQTMKLVHASTTAFSSSAMLEKHGSTHSSRSTRSSRLARQSRTCRVMLSRVETSQVEFGPKLLHEQCESRGRRVAVKPLVGATWGYWIVFKIN